MPLGPPELEASRPERSALIGERRSLRRSLAIVVATAVLWLAALRHADAEAVHTVKLPMRLEDNRIMIPCYVNGRGPYTFILDTGGGGDVVLTTALVKMLGLRERNIVTTHGGVGNAAVGIGETRVHAVAIGPLVFTNQSATVIDLDEIRDGIGFRRLDGVIGYSILRKLNMKLDFDRGSVTLSREKLVAPGGAHGTPFTLQDEIPRVAVTIDGIAGSAFVDTGDRSSLTLLNRFAAKYRFAKRFAGPDGVVTGFGIGGPIYGKIVRVPSLEVFGEIIPRVVTRISRQTAGGFAHSPEAANVGMGVLKRFNLIFDYTKQTIASWPSRAFDVAESTDASGMWLVPVALGARVYATEAGRPARASGLKVNDIIASVDGTSVRGVAIGDVRKFFFARADGSSHDLVVQRGKKTFETTIVLK